MITMSKEAKREMPTTKAMLITHPVRARILTALMGRPLTTQQIAALLPDIPLPSLYRHVRTLVEGGRRGASERRAHQSLRGSGGADPYSPCRCARCVARRPSKLLHDLPERACGDVSRLPGMGGSRPERDART